MGVCADCDFYEEIDTYRGQCRRYPPTVIEDHTVWPEVYAHEWCGEYSNKIPLNVGCGEK